MPHVAIGRALILAAALAVPEAAAQAMYKWVDEKGTTHFSQHPPTDPKAEKKATKITPRVIPPGNPDAYDPNAWKTRDAEAKKRTVDRGQQSKAEEREAAKRSEACDRARREIAMHENTPALYRDNADGTRTFVDDAERAAGLARARAAAEEACR